jgi:hypothetical protein
MARHRDGQELFSGTVPGHWEALGRLLDRYRGGSIQEERYHRQVVRRPRQFIGDRARVQNRIKSELQFHGVDLMESRGPWPRRYVEGLGSIRFGGRWIEESFQRLVEQYAFLSEQIAKQNLWRKSSEG